MCMDWILGDYPLPRLHFVPHPRHTATVVLLLRRYHRGQKHLHHRRPPTPARDMKRSVARRALVYST
jgi:hypothetical protein